jgi:hypothetical protein
MDCRMEVSSSSVYMLMYTTWPRVAACVCVWYYIYNCQLTDAIDRCWGPAGVMNPLEEKREKKKRALATWRPHTWHQRPLLHCMLATHSICICISFLPRTVSFILSATHARRFPGPAALLYYMNMNMRADSATRATKDLQTHASYAYACTSVRNTTWTDHIMSLRVVCSHARSTDRSPPPPYRRSSEPYPICMHVHPSMCPACRLYLALCVCKRSSSQLVRW